ncbi:hypothetical protein O988_03392 [Pseudogymnoascus sp. VKM F-3808]|nr:hypothetical protein O988_03392 [Pseudogymnoascus sp. VKM F-3808]
MKISLIAALGAATLVTSRSIKSANANHMAMERLMDMKVSSREKLRNDGYFKSGKFKSSKHSTACVNGKAGEYSCNGVDLQAFVSHEDLGSVAKEGNDLWGWTSDDGREFGAIGQSDGTAFVEVVEDGQIKYLGRLPVQTVDSIWRDIKVIDGYAYIGSEAAGYGLQVFDLRKLLTVEGEPKVFDVAKDLTAWFKGFGSSHNIVAHEEANMIYAVGTARNSTCKGGLFMVDVSDPANPTSPGCASEDGYVHDAQCVIYKGPDSQYNGQQICFNYNEDTLTIVDVTDKSAPKQISSTPYEGSSYTHQGWIVDPENMAHLLLDDELDEMDKTGVAANGHTTTYIFDISTLAKPTFKGYYQSPVKSIDHNQYIINGISYQSNYGSGLRIVDVSSVAEDPTGKGFKEIGFFDCHPEDDAIGGEVEFFGSWSVYPYFKSGKVHATSVYPSPNIL